MSDVTDFHLLLRNRHVSRVLVGVPAEHQHIRARIETAGGDVITIQEATLAAIARAYLAVSTHPTRSAVELRATEVSARKDGFAEVQLMETDADEAALRLELAAAPPEPPQDAPDPPTRPMPRAAEPQTDHAAPVREEADLDLDEPIEDDGPVFGDIPTQHSRPSLPEEPA